MYFFTVFFSTNVLPQFNLQMYSRRFFCKCTPLQIFLECITVLFTPTVVSQMYSNSLLYKCTPIQFFLQYTPTVYPTNVLLQFHLQISFLQFFQKCTLTFNSAKELLQFQCRKNRSTFWKSQAMTNYTPSNHWPSITLLSVTCCKLYSVHCTGNTPYKVCIQCTTMYVEYYYTWTDRRINAYQCFAIDTTFITLLSTGI